MRGVREESVQRIGVTSDPRRTDHTKQSGRALPKGFGEKHDAAGIAVMKHETSQAMGLWSYEEGLDGASLSASVQRAAVTKRIRSYSSVDLEAQTRAR